MYLRICIFLLFLSLRVCILILYFVSGLTCKFKYVLLEIILPKYLFILAYILYIWYRFLFIF
jgi:hypothetical protein